MTEPRNGGGVKTLGVKLEDALHSQFSLVVALDELSLSDGVVRAVALYVKTKQAEPGFAAKAQAKLEEIEREATTRREAIQALFGGIVPSEEAKTPKGQRRSAETSS
jgi:hypothetical protein